LAHLRRIRPEADRSGKTALCRRQLGSRSRQYRLPSTTIDLCLSVFPWAHFRSTKAVKMHTLLDLRTCIPSFIHISEGKLHDVNVLDLLLPEPGAIYVMDRGYVDFTRLYLLHQPGAFFVTRAKSNIDARRLYSAPSDRAKTESSVIRPSCLRASRRARSILSICGASDSKAPRPARRWCFLPTSACCRLQPSVPSIYVAGMFYGTSENAVKTQI
jgi:Transposase DDE domain